MKLTDSYLDGGSDIDICIGGDDDPDSPDMRLSFIKSGLAVWVDLTPSRMAELRDVVTAAILEAGFCPHGIASVNSDHFHEFCMACEKEWKARRVGNEP